MYLARTAAATGLSAAALALSMTGALASHVGSDGGNWSGDGGDPEAFRASSYINGDGGANGNVNPNSSCFMPDQYDRQRTSSKSSGKPGDRNVHNDACFLDRNGEKADGPASFQSFGDGYISACPDPDGTGPKYAVLRDTNGDGRKDLCFQSGYQESLVPGSSGDEEFHARVNKRGGEGRQRVVWCSDADADGCSDEAVADSITVRWVSSN